jgi:hypothetical protein
MPSVSSRSKVLEPILSAHKNKLAFVRKAIAFLDRWVFSGFACLDVYEPCLDVHVHE